MKTCSSCGGHLEENQITCPKCGCKDLKNFIKLMVLINAAIILMFLFVPMVFLKDGELSTLRLVFGDKEQAGNSDFYFIFIFILQLLSIILFIVSYLAKNKSILYISGTLMILVSLLELFLFSYINSAQGNTLRVSLNNKEILFNYTNIIEGSITLIYSIYLFANIKSLDNQ